MDNWLKACKSFFQTTSNNIKVQTLKTIFKQPQTTSNNLKQPQTISNNLKHRNNYKRRKPYIPQNIIYEKTFDLGNGTSLG